MEDTLPSIQQHSEKLSVITDLIDQTFSVKKNHEPKCFNTFVQSLKALDESAEKNSHSLVLTEAMQQHIVSTITEKLKYHDRKNNAYVAKQLSKHNPSFKTVLTRIKDAFNPDYLTQDAWYANATNNIPAIYQTMNVYGHNGGTMTPLSLAIKKAHLNWVGRLLAEGADPNKAYPTIYYGTTYPLCEVVQLIDKLKQSRSPKTITTPNGIYKNTREFYEKTKNAYYNILCLLLKNKARTDLGSNECTSGSPVLTPLVYAIQMKLSRVVSTLLTYGATLSDADAKYLKEEDMEWLKITKN